MSKNPTGSVKTTPTVHSPIYTETSINSLLRSEDHISPLCDYAVRRASNRDNPDAVPSEFPSRAGESSVD